MLVIGLPTSAVASGGQGTERVLLSYRFPLGRMAFEKTLSILELKDVDRANENVGDSRESLKTSVRF